MTHKHSGIIPRKQEDVNMLCTCMYDYDEQCFEDCPNCAVYQAKLKDECEFDEYKEEEFND